MKRLTDKGAMQERTGEKAEPCPLAVVLDLGEQSVPRLDSDPFSVVRLMRPGLASG